MTESYIEETEKLLEKTVSLEEKVKERQEELLESYIKDEKKSPEIGTSNFNEEENPQVAESMYRSKIEHKISRDKAEAESYIVPICQKVPDATQDLEIALTHLREVEDVIEELSNISSQLRGTTLAFDPERMLYDFMRSVYEITGDISEDFNNAGGQEIWGWGPNMEGGPSGQYLRMFNVLEVQHEVEEGETHRDEVEWDAEEFDDLERDHFEAIKNMAHEIDGYREKLNKELLTASIRIKDAVEALEEALENAEKTGDESLTKEIKELKEETVELQNNLKESVEIYNERLQRAEAYIDDFIDGNKKEIERILDGGTWVVPEDGMIGMKWDTPERYEDG